VAACGECTTTGGNAARDPACPVGVPSQVELTRGVLREPGYVEGRNIRLEFRSAAGNVDALPALAQGIVEDAGVDAIR